MKQTEFELGSREGIGIDQRENQEEHPRTSLVAQWLRIHLPIQGTQVQALVREDPTCCKGSHRSEKPMHRNEE